MDVCKGSCYNWAFVCDTAELSTDREAFAVQSRSDVGLTRPRSRSWRGVGRPHDYSNPSCMYPHAGLSAQHQSTEPQTKRMGRSGSQRAAGSPSQEGSHTTGKSHYCTYLLTKSSSDCGLSHLRLAVPNMRGWFRRRTQQAFVSQAATSMTVSVVQLLGGRPLLCIT